MKGVGRRRYKANKQSMVDRFGGGCQRCGYNRCLRALQFHHDDASEKGDWSGNSGRASAKEIEAHPERFLLLCANCHFEEHDRIDQAKDVMVRCERCGAEFRGDLHRLKQGRDRFCSSRCHMDHRMQSTGLNLLPRLQKYIRREGDCWVWTGYVVGGTSPALTTKNPDGKYSPKSAARLAYEIEFRENPAGKLYRTCPTPLCINPTHQAIRSY